MLADFYQRSALAAAQVLAGFDEQWFRSELESTPVGIAIGEDPTRESVAIADLVVRITARLYPKLALRGQPESVAALGATAREINPQIAFVDEARLGIAVGDGPAFPTTIFAGSDGWDALISGRGPQPTGDSENPLGPGLAACLAAAGLFRAVFLRSDESVPEDFVRVSALAADVVRDPTDAEPGPWRLNHDALLVGAGAIGQGALWALSRAPLDGRLHVIDMETVELSNLQRYVLTSRADVSRAKVDIAAALPSRLKLIGHDEDLAAFLSAHGHTWDAVLLAVDSARDRVSAQAMLPRFIANAWTQPGDLGVSAHSRFGGDGACVACLYLPTEPQRNEDELVAETLGVPQLLMQVRTLLATGQPVDRNLLVQIAQAIGQPLQALLPFEGRSVRELYVEGFCGGAVIPMGEAGSVNRAAEGVHVPLAHQSALAGILLAAALIRRASTGEPATTQVTRVDVLRPVQGFLLQPMRAARNGLCICDDEDFVSSFASKYALSRS